MWQTGREIYDPPPRPETASILNIKWYSEGQIHPVVLDNASKLKLRESDKINTYGLET